MSSEFVFDVSLEQVRKAVEEKDPICVPLLCRLIEEEPSEPQEPLPEGSYTFDTFLRETNSRDFRRKSLVEQSQYRIQKLQTIAASDFEPALPDRLQAYQILEQLWENCSETFYRDCLLELIAEVPLVYGPFKALKRIFKESESVGDTEIFGALAARFDMALDNGQHQVSQRTIAYLCRRGWRFLRRIGESLPAIYPDVAADFLVNYHGNSRYANSWIFNHIFFHELRAHKPRKFDLSQKRPASWQKYRAFSEAWKRSPRPLFALLEGAQSERVRNYATAALKTDFRAALREVEPEWVSRLIGKGSDTLDAFAVWILNNVPKFEQAKFQELRLHDVVLRLFDSESDVACKYAAEYARTHARDLPVDTLIALVNKEHKAIRKLGLDLLKDRDPRQDIGLDAWGQLLDIDQGQELAEQVLRKSFGAKELTSEWFGERILAAGRPGFQFACRRLKEVHSIKKLGPGYFVDLAFRVDVRESAEWNSRVAAEFISEQLEALGPENIDQNELCRLLIHPLFKNYVINWVQQGRLHAAIFGADFLMKVAYHPTWNRDEWIAEQKETPWGKQLSVFDESRADVVLRWLGDVREFSPSDLGFEWLMELVQRAEPRYHNFAAKLMSKAYLPADFAPSDASATPEESDETSSGEINVDLAGASFVFTGKLMTMQRNEAQGKVTTAGGANSNSVTKKLDYLVIGDEGSPLYGQGRKGSKQLKAEKFNEEGAEIRVISETAFLQMLAGEVREFSDDAIVAGCEHLWSLAVQEDFEAPISRFARAYIRQHHAEICLAETDRPVDPGAEMPDDFMSFARFLPLFSDSRGPLRTMALEFANYEFARWEPPIEGLVQMCESPFPEVREFVASALTSEEKPEAKRYRVNPEVLTADAVYSFCESKNSGTRSLGMKLIDLHPRLKLPEELFRLTESPDRQVRAFVIRTFWGLYRERGVTSEWKREPTPEQLTSKKKKKSISASEATGPGVPQRPTRLPSEGSELHKLLRRILFELPPGRPLKSATPEADEVEKLRPLPARLAKLNLIETLRDVALEDVSFAEEIFPLLNEFRRSCGRSESAACLVAVTRLERRFPELKEIAELPAVITEAAS